MQLNICKLLEDLRPPPINIICQKVASLETICLTPDNKAHLSVALLLHLLFM
jgi:hypothetical protein